MSKTPKAPKPARHPIQPTETDEHGTLRFKSNPIVQRLMTHGQKTGLSLNELARERFSNSDWEQFAQLIGYSVSGWGGLSYVSEDARSAAEAMVESGQTEDQARIAVLEEKLGEVRAALKELVPQLFRIHPDDLTT